MRINCPTCSSKAIITSRRELHPKLVQLYCACKSIDCGHTFVMDLSFRHSISPAAGDRKGIILDMFKSLPSEDRQAVMHLAGEVH